MKVQITGQEVNLSDKKVSYPSRVPFLRKIIKRRKKTMSGWVSPDPSGTSIFRFPANSVAVVTGASGEVLARSGEDHSSPVIVNHTKEVRWEVKGV